MKKIYVLCPGDSVTGGPELLHQFVHSLNENGCDANILYYPFSKKYDIPSAYSNYNIKTCYYNEVVSTDQVVVIPEVITGYRRYFKNAKIHIWWLSVDNYFKYFHNGIKGVVHRFIKYKTSPLRIKDLKDCEHLTQSHYAKEFLAKYGIKSYSLSDYLNESHIGRKIDLSNKQDIICYNPKKGTKITNEILNRFHNYNFQPIQNMTANEVASLLQRSKIYIDFGHHPGKDRIPREAAMAKCIVITGQKGSSGNSIDIPVSSKYKIDEQSEVFFELLNEVITSVFENYEQALDDFDEYRNKIKSEKDVFENEVKEFVQRIG